MEQLLEKRITKDSPYIRSFLGLNSVGEPKIIIAFKVDFFKDYTVFENYDMVSGFDYLESLGYDYSSTPLREGVAEFMSRKGFREVIV